MATMSSQFGTVQVSGDYIRNLHIKDEHRGQGHGTELMNDVVAEHGDRQLSLNARHDLHPFYERLGFKATGDVDFGQPRMTRPAQ